MQKLKLFKFLKLSCEKWFKNKKQYPSSLWKTGRWRSYIDFHKGEKEGELEQFLFTWPQHPRWFHDVLSSSLKGTEVQQWALEQVLTENITCPNNFRLFCHYLLPFYNIQMSTMTLSYLGCTTMLHSMFSISFTCENWTRKVREVVTFCFIWSKIFETSTIKSLYIVKSVR